MMAELWPTDARGKGAGLMQCGLAVGFFLAAFVWLYLGECGPESWRFMFLLGVLPALLTMWIRTSIDELKIWREAHARRCAAIARARAARRLPPASVRSSASPCSTCLRRRRCAGA